MLTILVSDSKVYMHTKCNDLYITHTKNLMMII